MPLRWQIVHVMTSLMAKFSGSSLHVHCALVDDIRVLFWGGIRTCDAMQRFARNQAKCRYMGSSLCVLSMHELESTVFLVFIMLDSGYLTPSMGE
jgi:hypothetical protein